MKRFCLIFCLLFAGLFVVAQTQLIDPNGNGGFENGTTFVSNGWTVVNGTSSSADYNRWVIGAEAAQTDGAYCAYISSGNTGNYGTNANYNYNYSGNSSADKCHFYIDVDFPSNEQLITLSFKWKGRGYSDNSDHLQVFLIPLSVTPVEDVAVNSSYKIGQTYYNNQTAWQSESFNINPSYAGTSARLVFSWTNNSTGNTNPPAAIDEISLISDDSDMQFGSATSSQASTDNICPGTINNKILRIDVETILGLENPLTVNSMKFNTGAGTTNASNDLAFAKVYYTVNSTVFSTENLAGTAFVNPNGEFVINMNQSLEYGMNYFWLSYDVSNNAQSGNYVDAEFISLTIDSNEYVPDATNPAGSRYIPNNCPPVNDECVNATELNSGGTFTGSNVYAEISSEGPLPEDPSWVQFSCNSSIDNIVYYTYTTGSSTTDLIFEFTDLVCYNNEGIQVALFNPITPCAGGSNWGSPIECVSPHSTNNFSFQVSSLSPNTQYYLLVDGYAGDRCNWNLSVQVDNPLDLGEDTIICDYDTPFAVDPGLAAPLTFLWSDGSTAPTLEVNTSGIYSLTITDGSFVASDTIEIIVNPSPNVDLGTDIHICETSAPIMLNAGDLTNTYLWNTSETIHEISVSTSGIFSVNASNSFGCTAYDEIEITVDQMPIINLEANISLCDYEFPYLLSGVSDPGYDYLWSTGEITPEILISTAGLYSVTVTNGLCETTASVLIKENTPPSIDLGPDTDICETSFPITLDGGAGMDSYLWSDASIGRFNNINAAGTYAVTVTDLNSCTATDQIIISADQMPSLDLGNDQILCDYNLPIMLNSGALPGYSVLWSDNSTNTDFEVTSGGFYSVSVTNGICEAIDEVNIEVYPAPSIDLGPDTDICETSFPIILDGGAGMDSYLWSDASIGRFNNINAAGTYAVTVTDLNSCTATDQIIISADQMPSLDLGNDQILCDYNLPIMLNSGALPGYSVLWSDNSTNTDFEVTSGGFYSVSVTNGICEAIDEVNIEVYPAPSIDLGADIQVCSLENSILLDAGSFEEYLWSNGDATQSIFVAYSGNYAVTITDVNGCTSSDEINISVLDEEQIEFSGGFDFCIYEIESQLSASPSGGLWTGNGVTDSSLGFFNPQIAGVGIHTLTYTISNSLCTYYKDTIVNVFDIPDINILQAINPTCFGLANGSINTESNSEIAEYIWETGQNTASIENLEAGTYVLQVTDVNSCTNSVTVELDQPEQMQISVFQQNNPTCFGYSDGIIDIDVEGGVEPYQFIWSNGSENDFIYDLSAGQYNVTVTDANSCSQTVFMELENPVKMDLNATATNINCGIEAGSIVLDVFGGYAPLEYYWSNMSENASQIYGLSPGNYSVTVIDANNCSVDTLIDITKTGNLTVQILELNEILCHNGTDAVLQANSNSVYYPFYYNWSNGSQMQQISEIGAGTYSVTITDALSCEGTSSIALANPAQIDVEITSHNISCLGNDDGLLNASASGGVGTYSYLWENGSSESLITGLAQGNYQLTVSDANGCSVVQNAIVDEPANPLEINIVTENNLCYGDENGFVAADIQGGEEPYFVEIRGENYFNSDFFGGNLRSGFYTINVQDNYGCSFDTIVIIAEPAELIASVFVTNPSCIGNNDGSIEIVTEGGTEPYFYSFENGGSHLPLIQGLFQGEYNIEISDSNNCALSLSTISLNDADRDCIIIPNAFTPNGDGINDTWVIEGINSFPNHIVQVFNRWGQLVYQGFYGDNEWDGRFNENFVPAGSYIYVIRLYDRELKDYTGIVTVIY